jgi:hypothetical protein
MCLWIPNFPFRNARDNIIVIGKDSNLEHVMRHPCLVPAEHKEEKERLFQRQLFVNAANFPHHNYVHVRNTENLVHEELPAPPTFNGFMQGKYVRFGGSMGNILRSKYLKHRQSGGDKILGTEGQKSDIVKDDEQENDIVVYIDEKEETGKP